MKKNRKIVALLVILALAIGLAFVPFKAALATQTYTYTLTFTATPGHTVVVNDGRLYIDGMGNIVELRDGNNVSIGTAVQVSEGVATITVENGNEGTLNYNGQVFSLHDGTNTYNYGVLNQNTSFTVQAPNSGGGDPVIIDNYNVNFGNASWVIGETTVTATVAGKTINNGTAVEIAGDEMITLTNFDPSTMQVVIRDATEPEETAFRTNLTVNNNQTCINNKQNDGGVPSNLVFYVEGGQAGPVDYLGPNDTVWFVWAKPDGSLGKYEVSGLTRSVLDEQTGLVTYTTKYIKTTDISADFDIDSLLSSEKYLWLWEKAFVDNNIADLTTWQDFESYVRNNIDIEDYDQWKAFAIDPCGASNGANIISTNGDRAFRATIYNEDNYYGISNASIPQELTFFPGFWDPGFFNPAYDISGSTINNPARIQSYLLEPKLVLKNDTVSAPIDSIELVSDILPSAVTITKRNDGNFEIVFNSNYYENVEFKVTSGNKTYYLMVNRVTIGCFRDELNQASVGLYVPEGDTDDYDVIETWYFSDGSEMQCNLTAEGVMQGGVNVQLRTYVRTAEENSKINLNPNSSNPPTGVLYTVVRQGSTTAKYKGTLSGSGKGTYFKLEEGNFILSEKGGLN